ncbi:hypothetical protein PsorP6_003290 [Peronosclerospora sorghi]|uniref:Uncharacterized protein n=1 Tax=Peronosclerospora sorghi TaxID=230839 RepID=A0ACC0VMH6_9STRA|nr:hypothetical protein PsorP6_003290 [Peronosclerospora sorghi]
MISSVSFPTFILTGLSTLQSIIQCPTCRLRLLVLATFLYSLCVSLLRCVMTSMPPSIAMRHKRSQEQEETFQQLTTPCEDVASVKRRRSSAEKRVSTSEKQQIPVEEAQYLVKEAPETELYLVTVKTWDELKESADVASEAKTVDDLLLQRHQETQAENMDGNWSDEFAALDSIRRFAKHHQELAKRQLENGVLNQLVLPAVSSLRSALARTALLCMQELILALKSDMVAHFDVMVPVLLNRVCSEKQFLNDLAREVLDTVLQAGANEEFLSPLLTTSTTEKNAQIVNVAGLYATKCILRMDRAHLRAFVLEKRASFFEELALFLNCKVVECKAATRRSSQHTRQVIGNEKFVALAKAKLSGTALADVLKASESRKTAKPEHAKSSMRERMQQLKKQQQQKKVQSGGNDISVVIVAPPRSRSSTQAAPSL